LIVPEAAGRVSGRRNPAARLLRETGPVLSGLLEAVPPPEALVALAHMLPAAPRTKGAEAVNALRRAAPATVLEVCRRALAGPDGPDLRAIWAATGDRPLARAVATLGTDTLLPLTVDEPLPGRLRPLSHLGEVTAARTIDLVALRVRAALGRLLRADDQDLTRAVREGPAVPMLCAMTLAATSWGLPGVVLVEPGGERVPGFPSTVLTAEPWTTAGRDAAELGSEPGGTGLVVPFSWLGGGGWPALWSRAARSGQ
jgi:hypothetical protein